MTVHYVDNLKDEAIKKLISDLSSGDVLRIGLDTETTSLDPHTCELLLVQINVKDNIYVLNRGALGNKFFSNLLNLINEYHIVCIGHNIKYDYKVLLSDTGVKVRYLYDTMVCESVLRSGIGDKLYSLKTLLNKYFGIEVNKEERLEFISLHQDSSFTEQQIDYAATDVLYLLDIYNKQVDEAHSARLVDIFTLEMQVLPVVADMEFEGINLDRELWIKFSDESVRLTKEKGDYTKNLIIDSIDVSKYNTALEFSDAVAIPVKTKKARAVLETITDPLAIVGWIKENFNMGSPLQLVKAINLAGVKAENTNEKTINKLPKNPIIDSIIEYREYGKEASSYGYNIIDLINPKTGKIHTEYFPVGTVTGRFSSSDPNLQNIPPKRRPGFVSRPGYSFLAMDYSQQEFRLVGAISKEARIIEAYVKGSDMHIATAANRFHKSLEEVTHDERKIGKTLNFAVIYGTTPWGLKRNFDISLDEAEQMLIDYWNGYPTLTAFKTAVENKIVELGYSVTPMGRRRYFKPKPSFGTPYEIDKYYSKLKREGFNMIIQGGGADITKIALYRVDAENPFGDKFVPILQVHDEIVAEVEDSLIDNAIEYMSSVMKSAFQPFLGEIPAVVEWNISKRWMKG